MSESLADAHDRAWTRVADLERELAEFRAAREVDLAQAVAGLERELAEAKAENDRSEYEELNELRAQLTRSEARCKRMARILSETADVLDAAASNSAGLVSAELEDPLAYAILVRARDRARAAIAPDGGETDGGSVKATLREQPKRSFRMQDDDEIEGDDDGGP